MATRRMDREDHVKQYLAQMLSAWHRKTGRDMEAAIADRRMQQCTTQLIDLMGEAEKVDEMVRAADGLDAERCPRSWRPAAASIGAGP